MFCLQSPWVMYPIVFFFAELAMKPAMKPLAEEKMEGSSQELTFGGLSLTQ